MHRNSNKHNETTTFATFLHCCVGCFSLFLHTSSQTTLFFFWSATIVYLNFYEEKMSKLKKRKKKRKRDEYKLQTKLMYFTIYIQFFFIKKIDSILLQDMGWE